MHTYPSGPGWPLRTELELIDDQLRGLAAFTAERRGRTTAPTGRPLTREMQLDGRRRREVDLREQTALQEHAARQLRESAHLLASVVRPRAVLAHRNAWLRTKVADCLHEHGVQVVAVLDDGAEACGVTVVEQPEILLVEDRLTSMSGLEVLRRVQAFAPKTLVAAQLQDSAEVQLFLEEGARAVFTRRTPPADIALEAVQCLQEIGAPFAAA